MSVIASRAMRHAGRESESSCKELVILPTSPTLSHSHSCKLAISVLVFPHQIRHIQVGHVFQRAAGIRLREDAFHQARGDLARASEADGGRESGGRGPRDKSSILTAILLGWSFNTSTFRLTSSWFPLNPKKVKNSLQGGCCSNKAIRFGFLGNETVLFVFPEGPVYFHVGWRVDICFSF